MSITYFDEEEEVEYELSFDIGDVIEVNNVTIINNVGGTTNVPLGNLKPIKVKVTKCWYDYECGFRFNGECVDERVFGLLDEKGRVAKNIEYVESYKQYTNNPDIYLSAKKAYDEYNPKLVLFSEHDLNLEEN